jgi:D-alanyl-D-alanine carboxypeptidase/D-alanyl-D-alanine-endopeptidase (penicillin-binding protein 4)
MKLGVQLEGESPLQRNPLSPMLPASVQKMVTAAAALKILGPYARFENRFYATWNPASSTLNQPVFEVSGDPTWGHEAYGETQDMENPEGLPNRLDALIGFLKSKGITRVAGPVSVISLRPDLAKVARPEGWRKSWTLECMASLPTEFIASANCGLLRVEGPGRARWMTEGVSVPVRVKVVRSKEGSNNLGVTPGFDSMGRITSYTVTGYLARGPVTLSLPVHQGTSWLRNSFVERLKKAGIEYQEASPVQAERSMPSSEPAEPLRFDLSSDNLLEILRPAVQLSLNGVMDRIFLEVGYRTGREASSEVEGFVSELVKNPDALKPMQIFDGSGLNLSDRVSADLLHRFLDRVRSEPYFLEFLSTLAIAGKAGTLLSRPVLVSSSYTYGKIFGKSGTLSGVINLAGYYIPSEGARPEPFVVLSESSYEGSKARALIDGIVVNFAGLNARP